MIFTILEENVFQEEPKDLKMDKSTENDAYDESKEKPRSVSRGAKKLPAHMIIDKQKYKK